MSKFLDTGHFDGQVVEAPMPPGTVRFGLRVEEEAWSELYMYTSSREEVSGRGVLPVMQFHRRDKEDGEDP